MALSLRTAFLIAACAAPAGVFACSSSGGGGNSTTSTGTGGGTGGTTTSSSSHSGSTTSSSSTVACSASMDGGAAACQACCETAHPAGFALFTEIALANCACASSGPCFSQCGGGDGGVPSFCASDAASPSTACGQCMEALGGQSPTPSCLTSAATGSACSASTDCTAFAGCGLGC